MHTCTGVQMDMFEGGAMNHASALGAEKVRDADLVKRLAEAKGVGAEFVWRQCVAEQERRDALAAMPRDTRRRAETRYALEEQKGADRDNLRHIHSVLAMCSLPYQ